MTTACRAIPNVGTDGREAAWLAAGTGSPLHVALFLSGLAGGGAQRRMLHLANAFCRRGHRVDVVVARSEGPFRSSLPSAARLIDVDTKAARVPAISSRRGPRVLATTWRLAAYLRRERPDVVMSTSNPANLATIAARRAAGVDVPVVLRLNVNLSAATDARGRAWPHLLRVAMKRAYPLADRIVAVSAGVAADACTRFGLDARRIDVIANPIEIDAIRRAAAAPVDHPWLQSGAPPLVLAVGKLALQKDYASLLRAFAQLRRRHEAKLVILGEGSERRRLERIVRDLSLSGDVAMPGFAENPFAWMGRASVFVLSSAWEGCSNVLGEALACGCPVVSTDCPSGPRGLLDHGRFGRLVPVGDPRALADAIRSTLDRPLPRRSLRDRAAEFSVDAAAGRYLDVLADAAGAPLRRPAAYGVSGMS